MAEALTMRRQGAIGIITLNYTQHHPRFGPAMVLALLNMLKALDAESDCRAMVLAGAGDDFCPGGDAAGGRTDDPVAARAQGLPAIALFRELALAPKPVIAAIEGRAEAAGLALAAACDWVVAGAGAVFRCDAVGTGSVPDLGLMWSLPQRVGMARARRIMLSGASFGAAEAAQWGLAGETVGAGQALAAALAAAERYQRVPPVALALAKAALFNGPRSFDQACRQELDLAPLARLSADHKEAVAAFLEKRQPRFTGV